MKKFLILAFVLAPTLVFGQTFEYQATAAINAGQCVAIYGNFVSPCNNALSSPVAVAGIALNTVSAAPPRSHTTVIVQYAGLTTIPNTNDGTSPFQQGDYIGDVDGTGNLGDLTFPVLGPLYVGNGPFGNAPYGYVGIFVAYANVSETQIIVLIQPGYVPASLTGGSDTTFRTNKRN
jgi:hypothetical protein